MRHSLLLAGLACAATLALTTTAHAAPAVTCQHGTEGVLGVCHRDNAPPNREYVRYINARSKVAPEARMRAELPAHQRLLGCNAKGG